MDEIYNIFIPIHKFTAEEVSNWLLLGSNSSIPDHLYMGEHLVNIEKTRSISNNRGEISYEIIFDLQFSEFLYLALHLNEDPGYHKCKNNLHGILMGKLSVIPIENGCQVFGKVYQEIELFKKMEDELKIIFQDGENKELEPWKSSKPKKIERDKIIWEMREAGNTWEDIAEKADCAVNTAKVNYGRMKNI